MIFQHSQLDELGMELGMVGQLGPKKNKISDLYANFVCDYFQVDLSPIGSVNMQANKKTTKIEKNAFQKNQRFIGCLFDRLAKNVF
jgi:hypothetical protein